MSYIFEAGDATVWSPALRVGSLFVTMAECLANWEGVPTGLSAMASDYYEIDVEAFGALVRALLNDSSAGHAIFGQILHGFIATCLVMLERAGAALPETGRSAEEISRLTSQAAANMPV
jgi:hypothetical protein